MIDYITRILCVVFVVVLTFSVNSCQCHLRAGDGITSHFNPFLGCVFERK